MSDQSNARLPGDPSGIDEPHDVLAAEEFAMPTGGGILPGPGGVDPRTLLPALALLAALLLMARRLRR